FQYQNVNGASFDLYANGTFFGYYQYAQLPLTIPNFPKSGGNNDWIKVCDNDNENCCKVLEFDTKECGNNGDCEIYDLSVDKGECTSDSTYTLTINFQYQNVNGASFDLYANGTFFGYYQYAQLPLTISNFPKSGGNNDWIKVCDNDNENCCKVLEFDTKECGNNGDCSIKELEAIVGDCNEDDLFYVTINFVAMNPGSQGFSILGNGMNYGSFSYDSIPIILGPFEGNCDKEWEFVVKDNEFEFCSKGIDVGKVCCNVEPCEIYDLEVVVGECTGDSTYALTFNFQVQNPGNNYFEVWTNGDYFGNFPLADLPMTIDFPAGGFNIDELKVCINDQPNCCKTIEFEPPSCLQMPVYTINASNAKKSSQTSTGNNNTFKEQNLNQVNGLKSSFTARTFPGEQRLLILTTPGSIVQHIRIMDAVGRLVGEESPGSGGSSNQFDVPVLALNGIVFVQVTFADGRMVRKIFIP
ncbi:MAG: T9SS type A sorting domain-containing protein, partial [Saprospiraceae bacterium]|nr:T9SS type A sorting domain-containing protein [Saprospiraceae bacterium]